MFAFFSKLLINLVYIVDDASPWHNTLYSDSLLLLYTKGPKHNLLIPLGQHLDENNQIMACILPKSCHGVLFITNTLRSIGGGFCIIANSIEHNDKIKITRNSIKQTVHSRKNLQLYFLKTKNKMVDLGGTIIVC